MAKIHTPLWGEHDTSVRDHPPVPHNLWELGFGGAQANRRQWRERWGKGPGGAFTGHCRPTLQFHTQLQLLSARVPVQTLTDYGLNRECRQGHPGNKGHPEPRPFTAGVMKAARTTGAAFGLSNGTGDTRAKVLGVTILSS